MNRCILVSLLISICAATSYAAPSRYQIQADTTDIQIGDLLRVLGRAHMDSAVVDTIYGTTNTGAAFVLIPITNSTGRLGSNGKRFLSISVDTLRHTVSFDSTDYVDGGIAGADLAGTLSGNKIWTGTQTHSGTTVLVAADST